MKTTLSLALLTVLTLSACDKSEQAAAEAKVREVSAEAKVKTEGAIEKMKAAGAEAAEKTKEVSADVFEKSKVLAGEAMEKTRKFTDSTTDFAKEKLGIPETDGLLDGLNGLFTEAADAIKDGRLKEKTDELNAKWNTLYAKAEANAETLAPEAKTRMKTFLAKLRAKWDALISSGK